MLDLLAPTSLLRRHGDLLLAALVFAAAASFHLAHLPAEMRVDSDVARNVLIGQDCAAGDGCAMRLNPAGGSSIAGLFHGAALNHFLGALFWLGADLRDAATVAMLLLALAVALTFLVASRVSGVAAGLLAAAALELFLTALYPMSRSLWNPTLMPLPAALFAAAAALYAATHRLRFLLLAAVGAALSIEVHLAAVVQLGSLIYLVAITPRGRRFVAALAVGATLWSLLQLGSPAIVVDTVFEYVTVAGTVGQEIENTNAWQAFLAGYGLLALVAGVAAWRARLAWERAAIRMLLITQLPIAVLHTLLLSRETRYALGFSASIALLFALSVAALLRIAWHSAVAIRSRVQRALAIGLVTAGTVATLVATVAWIPTDIDTPEVDPFLSAADMERVAALLGERGWSLEAAARHLRAGVDHGTAVSTLACAGDLLPREPHPDLGQGHDEDLEITLAPSSQLPAQLPPGWELARQRRGASLLLHSYQPALQWDHFTLCHVTDPANDDADCRCREIEYRLDATSHPDDAHLRMTYSSPSLAGSPLEATCPYLYVVRVPLRLTDGAVTLVAGKNGGQLTSCAGVIAAAPVAAETPSLPAREVRVEAPAEGHVVAVWDLCAPGCATWAPSLPLSIFERYDDFSPPPLSEDATSRVPESINESRIQHAIACAATGRNEGIMPWLPSWPEPLLPLWWSLLITATFALATVLTLLAVASAGAREP